MGTKNILKFRIDKVHIVLQWGIMLFIVFCSSKNAKIITCQYSFMLIQTDNILHKLACTTNFWKYLCNYLYLSQKYSNKFLLNMD